MAVCLLKEGRLASRFFAPDQRAWGRVGGSVRDGVGDICGVWRAP